MKKIIFILIISVFLTGCFNYRDINRIVFVTALCIDIDENKDPVIYAEAFRAIRSTEAASGEEARTIFKGNGKTIFEAIRNMNRTSSLKLNYTQNKSIIFSEKAARYGLDDFLDSLIRDQELLVRQYLYISTVDLEELLETKLPEEMFVGIYLSDLAENLPSQTKEPQMRIDHFFVERKLGSKINPISLIEKKKDALIDRLVLDRVVLFSEGKMIEALDGSESFFYNLVEDNIATGFLRTSNPDSEGDLVTLEILRAKTKTNIHWNGSTFDIIKNINIKTTIADAENNLTLIQNPSDTALIKQSAEKNINETCLELFEKYKEKEIDIYNLKRYIDIKYPNIDVDRENILDYINLTIESDVFVEGSTDIIDYY